MMRLRLLKSQMMKLLVSCEIASIITSTLQIVQRNDSLIYNLFCEFTFVIYLLLDFISITSILYTTCVLCLSSQLIL